MFCKGGVNYSNGSVIDYRKLVVNRKPAEVMKVFVEIAGGVG